MHLEARIRLQINPGAVALRSHLDVKCLGNRLICIPVHLEHFDVWVLIAQLTQLQQGKRGSGQSVRQVLRPEDAETQQLVYTAVRPARGGPRQSIR